MKILNLFSGIGGNRTLWGDSHEITAVEFNSDIANIYSKRFPNDKMFIEDAFSFLERHLDEFDFIWASPPCQTHSRLNAMCFKNSKKNPSLPDLRLYSIILYLKQWFKGNWVVENVIPYYEPLIPPTVQLDRHYFWSNYFIPEKKFLTLPGFKDFPLDQLCQYHHIPLEYVKHLPSGNANNHDNKRQVLRNCVFAEIGQYLLQCGLKPTQMTLNNYTKKSR